MVSIEFECGILAAMVAPGGASDPGDVQWRDQLALRLSRAFLGVFAAILVLVFTTVPSGPDRWLLAATAALGLVMVAGPALLERPSGRLRSWLIVLPAIAGALSGYATVGFLSAPGTVLAMSIMLSGLLLGRRTMFMLTSVCGLVIGFIAWSMVRGTLVPLGDGTSLRDPIAWVRTLSISFFAIGLFGALMLAVIGRMERSLELARAETARRERAERERADAEIALLQSRQLETIGRMAAGVAHDFNNNLTAIMGCAELLAMDAKLSADNKELAADVLQASQHAASLTRQLLAYSRQAQMLLEPTDVHALVGSALSLVARSADPRTVISSALDATRAIVLAEPALLQNAMLNLLVNAIDAMPTGGELRVTTAERKFAAVGRLPAGQYLVVEVRDTGSGIAPEILPRIFEPFFTSKLARRGTGLGLAGVAATAEALHGAIDVDSEVGRGSRFTLRLPLADSDAVLQMDGSDVPVHGTGRLLIVDDEVLVRHAAVALLRSLGYDVSEVADGASAVDAVERCSGRFDLVLLDLRMPRQTGEMTLAALLKVDPTLRVIVWSGHLSDDDLQRLKAAGAIGFVAKPYRAAHLSRTIAEAIQRPA